MRERKDGVGDRKRARERGREREREGEREGGAKHTYMLIQVYQKYEVTRRATANC